MTVDLFVDKRVEALHQGGVRLAKARKFDQAYEIYDEAGSLLDTGVYSADRDVVNLEDSKDASIDFHRARLQRDLGFLTVRRLAAGEKLTAYGPENMLSISLHETQEYLDSGERMFTKRSWEWLLAEHGATLGLIGRTTLLRGVLAEPDDKQELLDDARRAFNEAQSYLFQGDNRYYETSNAMYSAKAEKLSGNLLLVASWVLRAADSVKQAATSDRDHLASSVLTFGRGVLPLWNRRLVESSVVANP